MKITYQAACGCFVGNGGRANEDNFYFNRKRLQVSNQGLKHPLKSAGDTDSPLVFAVFDGMGGGSMGEVAAHIASRCFSEECKKLEELAIPGKEILYSSCKEANAQIVQYQNDQQLSTMGTTVAALYFNAEEVVACNVGDSKIFRIRDNTMIQISMDHTDEKIMKAIGVCKKPVLLQYLGSANQGMALDPFISKGEVYPGDTYVLCTDGVTDAVTLAELYELSVCNEAEETVKNILTRVDEVGGTDNATAIVIKIYE